MVDFKSLFNRETGNTGDTPEGITEKEFNQILGRDIIPNWMQDSALSIRNKLDGRGSIRNGPGSLKFNARDETFDLEKENLTFLLENLNFAADSYYMLRTQHSTHKRDYETGSAVPLRLEIGVTHFTHAWDQFDRHHREMGVLVDINIDHRDRRNIHLVEIDTHNLGLKNPATMEEKIAALGVVGRWLKQVDVGEKLDPYECRKQLMDKAGLKPTRSIKGEISEHIGKIWAKKFPEVTRDVSQKHADRLKRLSAAIMRRGKGRTP